MKNAKLFLFLAIAVFAYAVEEQAVLVSISFSQNDVSMEKAEFGIAEVPDYSLKPEHPLFFRFYSGTKIVKEIETQDPRFIEGEIVENGIISEADVFKINARKTVVLPLITGACTVRVFDENETKLISFNACTLEETKGIEEFVPYSNFRSRDFDYWLLSASVIVCICIAITIWRKRKTEKS